MVRPFPTPTIDERSRVLVCDDEPNFTRLLEVNLERAGFEPVVARNGRECLELLREGQFAAAFVDLIMPGMDGYEVLEWIRTNPETKDLWLAFISTSAKEYEDRVDLPHRADAYVQKPFDPRRFFA